MRVLIVEDEPNLGRQLRATLEGAGYAVDLATDGEDGHYLGSTENYDAVILDLGLPEVDGLTVLDRWRKEGRKMPVLVIELEWRHHQREGCCQHARCRHRDRRYCIRIFRLSRPSRRAAPIKHIPRPLTALYAQ